jgi:hypothetical protein
MTKTVPSQAGRLTVSLITLFILILLGGGCGSANLTPSNGGSSINNAGENHFPVVDKILLEYTAIERGKSGDIKCNAYDPDGDKLTYTWEASRGNISGKGPEVKYTAPNSFVNVTVTVTVKDGRGGFADYPVAFDVVCCSYAQKNPEWPK